MIDKDLLNILACPESHQALSEAAADVLDAVNGKIQSGDCKNVGGKPVGEPLQAGLVREDGKVVYPIKEGIPVLLVDEGIAL